MDKYVRVDVIVSLYLDFLDLYVEIQTTGKVDDMNM